jgi:hypothetical protein
VIGFLESTMGLGHGYFSLWQVTLWETVHYRNLPIVFYPASAAGKQGNLGTSTVSGRPVWAKPAVRATDEHPESGHFRRQHSNAD